MTPNDLEVSIMDGPMLVQRWVCAGTTLPDGRPGVVWRGVVYPLMAGHQIDVSAPLAGGDLAPSFGVLPGDEATWVLLQGPSAERAKVQVALKRAGIAVLRVGRWLGEPFENQAYDWFICCEGEISLKQITEVLGASPQLDRGSRAYIAILELRLAELKAVLAERDAVLLRGSLVPDVATATTLLSLNPKLEEMKTAFSAPMPELSKKTTDPFAQSKTTLRLQDEISAFLSVLRPDVTLLRDSLLVAVGEFASRASFYRAIHDLRPEGSRPNGWKSLRGAERWWERHVSTGQNDSGRIYARFDITNRRWLLLLGWKVEQARDIAWICRLV